MPKQEAAAAVRAAYEYLVGVSPNSTTFTNFRLEEISTDQDGNFLITLSYELAGEFGFDRKKEYKDFQVDKENRVVSMKIRNV